MANRRELIKYLRFQLQEELPVDNGAHTFEQICKEVARLRLASNLIPATGPVGGGGDAGRDFETFKSYLPKELGEHSAFVLRMSDKALAFACTLEKKERVPTKFAKDVETIVKSGDKFDHVYAMCTAAVDVGRRNRLRRKVKKEHGIDLTLLDGEWLAEQLADPDLFWVADAYLSVPAHMAPPPEAGEEDKVPAWYANDLAKWKERGELRPTPGDLLDAKDGLRYASFYDNARQDLEFWLALINPLTGPESPRELRQRARYEYSVAVLKGRGELRPADAMVRAYLRGSVRRGSRPTAGRMGVAHLCGWSLAAERHGPGSGLPAGDERQAPSHLHTLLSKDPPPTYRARLLQALGSLGFQPDVQKLSQPDKPEPVEIDEYFDENGDFQPPQLAQSELPDLLVAVDEGMAAWSELAATLEEASLFPVDELAKMMNLLAPLLAGHEKWRDLVEDVEEAVRRTAGDAAVAEGARDRAMSLYKAGRPREAVGELHAAKANWWSGDSLEGSLLAMLLIGDIYRRLGLMYASKQYALAVTMTAAHSGEDRLLPLVARGLFMAAEAEYFAGAWCGAAELFELGFKAVHQFSDSMPDDSEITAAMFNFASLVRSTEVLMPDLKTELDSSAANCGMQDLLDAVAEVPVASAKKYIDSADEELYGRPFADVGPERVIRFKALGLDWTIRCANEYEHVLVAERFAAAAQILLVELANEDLCLLPTSIDVRVEPSPGGPGERVVWQPSNEGRVWSVKLLPDPAEVTSQDGGMPDHDLELLGALSAILVDASLLPDDAYMKTLEDAFRRGLNHKLSSGRPYDELAAAMVSKTDFNGYDRKRLQPPADSAAHPAREHPDLAWQSGPGPTYSREAADEMNTNRYERFQPSLRMTLPRLLADAQFRDLVARLRSEGWKDWHVLVAVASRTQSLRIQVSDYTHEDLADPEVRRKLERVALEPEDPKWPQPPAFLYTYEELVWTRRVAMLHTVKFWNLEVRQPTPDFPAIEKLLSERYAYWSDDVEHADPFPQVTNRPKPREPARKKTRARRN